ncbi:MAG: tRNA lysidine(34) synthetase TilS [Alphaproteobacteria bacterium]|nr:tRNA lysidine(34) synthetase TilS [Alphaproteobacteria bacterium]
MADQVTGQYLSDKLNALGVPKGAPLAIAVSGGPDSMALALLAATVRDVVCLTVDHGLREEAAAEAHSVGQVMKGRGIEHHILSWEGDKPSTNIQAAARTARYALMARWCQKNGITHLLTAHHQDDQAETLLMRLARGSGVYGLAAMAPVTALEDGRVTLVRPLLEVQKQSLVQYLEGQSVGFVEDPSNKAEQFDRVKVRQFLAEPPLEGFRVERLAETAARLRRSRDALEFYEAEWLSRFVNMTSEGHVEFNISAFEKAPEEIVLRGVATCCRFVSGQRYVPRMEKLERARLAMASPDFSGQTLYGTQFMAVGDGNILMFRELASTEGLMPVKDGASWDKRFEISASGDIAGLEVGALGLEGWSEAVKLWPELRDSDMPFAARLVLPAIFHDGKVCAIPHLNAEFGPKRDISLSLKSIGWPKK